VTKEIVENSKNPRGRPSPAKTEQIKKTLRPYFDTYVSETYTSQVTKINVNTVSKYFREWKKELMKIGLKDLIESHEVAKRRGLHALDSVIASVNDHMAKIEKLRTIYDVVVETRLEKGDMKLPNIVYFLENKKIELNKFYVELIGMKVSIEVLPTIGEDISNKIKEMVKKNDLVSKHLVTK